MSLFKKIFGAVNDLSNEEKNSETSPFLPEDQLPVDELFMLNFRKNGGKFIYCDNLNEVHEQFLNVLEENDWFECEVICFEPKLYSLLDENKLTYTKSARSEVPSCMHAKILIADEGSILFSSNQIKQNKPNELPANIVIFATTSQILGNKSDGLREIKRKYDSELPY